ncbi:hypothetical protein SEPCBS119000_003600 [Sporothrix epigloea]|uniref:Wings apart-like protein C-terminal domain-containing protein n=1 Tax=Sporothrix epigloea TaxID=1892477 RepID=A0ABP0DR65_9PEZI
MSTLNGMGQRPKKGLPTSYGARSGLKSRSQTSTSSFTGTPGPSQSGMRASAKDIYDYDFVDDAPPPPTPLIRSRPPSSTRPPSSASKEASKRTTTSITPLAPSPMSASIAVPRGGRSESRDNTLRNAPEAPRGTKRKPRAQEYYGQQRTSNLRSISSAASSRSSGPFPSTETAEETSVLAAGSAGVSPKPSREQSRKIKAAQAGRAQPLSPPLYQRVAKTPPLQDLITFKSPPGTRSPTQSPRRLQSSILPTSTSKATREPHQLHAEARPPQRLPIRPTDSKPIKNSNAKPRALQQTSALAEQEKSGSQRMARNKRRRLIDTLASQIEDSSSDGESIPAKESVSKEDDQEGAISDEDTNEPRRRSLRSTPISDGCGSRSQLDLDSLATTSPSKSLMAPSTPGTITRRTTARRPGVKFTYNLERTMLADRPVELGGPQGSDLSLLESLLPEPEAKPAPFDLDGDMGGESQSTVQSIHELRQAGANSRFADQLLDILDRIGAPSLDKPSSARRSALLEMMQELQEKSFLRHFRDQGAELQLFRNVGRERDVVAGFTIMGIMITLLASGPASHRLLREIQQHGIQDLFLFLLAVDADIVTFAKDRKANVSNYMRQQLNITKEALRRLPGIWRPATALPSKVSPRTACLAAMHIFAQQLQSDSGDTGSIDEEAGALNAALTKELFAEVSAALPSSGDEDEDELAAPPLLPSGLASSSPESVDLHLSLSLLEMHSVSALQSDIRAEWTLHRLPIIAQALEDSLVRHQQDSSRLNEMELLVLKLALNTANNNPDAARYYVDKGLLRMLAELSAGALESFIQSARTGEWFTSDTLNELLLMLGVMINFSENDTAAGETLVQGGGLDVIDRLGRAFLDGTAMSSEADSEEKSQLNVAFAYLSILLGYLCLYDPIRQAFGRLSPSRSTKPLLDSINQFIILHDQIGKTESSEHGVGANHFTARLRALTQELAARAY